VATSDDVIDISSHEADEISEFEPPETSKPARAKRAAKSTSKDSNAATEELADDLNGWLLTVDPGDWGTRRVAYLWRTAPVFDTKSGGRVSHIKKFRAEFDIDTIMESEGSGGYRIDVVLLPPAGGKGTRERQFYFEIMNPAFPPNLPLGDWVENGVNKRWLWSVPILRQRDLIAEQSRREELTRLGSPNNQDTTAQVVAQAVRAVRGEQEDNDSVAAQLTELVKDNNERMAALMDPSRQFDLVQKLIGLVQPKGNDPMMQFVLDELREQRAQNARLMEKVMAPPPPPPPPVDPIDGLERLAAAGSKLRSITGELFGGTGKSKSGTDWGEIFGSAVKEFLPMVPNMFNGYLNYLAFNNRPQPAPVTVNVPTPTPVEAPKPQVAPPLPPGVTQQQIDEENKRLHTLLNKYGPAIALATPFIDDYLKNGMTGYDLRDWFIQRRGMEAWVELRRDFELPERFLALLQVHPASKGKVPINDETVRFAKEFLTEQGKEEGIEPPDNDDIDDEEEDDEQQLSTTPALLHQEG
jgi:hypothetical protein